MTTAKTMTTYIQKHRKRIVVHVVLLIIVWLFVGGSDGFWAQWRMSRDIDALRRENAELRVQNIRLREQITRLQSDMQYIERIARERYGMAQPGERVYRIVPGTSGNAESNRE